MVRRRSRSSSESGGGHRRRRRTSFSNDGSRPDGAPAGGLSAEVENQVPPENPETPGAAEESERDLRVGSQQLAAARAVGGPIEKEIRLKLLHRLLMRGIPITKIAEAFGVTPSTIHKDRQTLYKLLREEARRLDLNKFIGDSMGFYGEVQAQALREASDKSVPVNARMAALRTALNARNDLMKFFDTAGVLEVLKFEPEKNEGKSDLEKIGSSIDALLKDDLEDATGLTLPEGTDDDEDDDVSLTL